MELGELESEVLQVVRVDGEVSARDVFRVLYAKKDMAYSTVSTTLMRLHKKGLLDRRSTRPRGNVVYLYSLAEGLTSKEYVQRSLDKLVRAFGPDLVSAAAEDMGLDQ